MDIRTPTGAQVFAEHCDDIPKAFPFPQVVWHYTGFKGLEGILNGKIWASSAACLNDTEEFRHTTKIALEILQQEQEHGLVDFQHAADSLARFFSEVDGKTALVASFSEKRDDLSQWRAYGGKGPVFAIGFSPEKLAAKGKESGFDFEKVIYDQAYIEEYIRSEIRRICDGFKANEQARNQELYRSISFGTDVIGSVFPLAIRCKHEKFRDEQEWRLSRLFTAVNKKPRLNWNFREAGSLVVPYVEVPLHKVSDQDPTPSGGLTPVVDSPIVEIVIGPNPHPEHVRYAVGDMMLRRAIHATVSSSAIPYRNW
jgi:hypothetical protein